MYQIFKKSLSNFWPYDFVFWVSYTLQITFGAYLVHIITFLWGQRSGGQKNSEKHALQVLRIASQQTWILSCISLVCYFFYTWGTCIEISRDLHWNLRLFSKTLATCHSQLLQNVAEARSQTRAGWMRGKCANHSAMRTWYK